MPRESWGPKGKDRCEWSGSCKPCPLTQPYTEISASVDAISRVKTTRVKEAKKKKKKNFFQGTAPGFPDLDAKKPRSEFRILLDPRNENVPPFH